MEKVYKHSLGMVELNCDTDHILHRKGDAEYPETRHMHVLIGQEDDYEEIADADIPPYTQAQYKAKIVELIRARYDQDDENGILRQRDTKPDEFAEYNDFVEQCKATAREILTAPAETPANPDDSAASTPEKSAS